MSRRSSRACARARRGECARAQGEAFACIAVLTDVFYGAPSLTSLVILAGDISPLDILSHIPILCEEQDVPYIFVASKESLGAASSTKRPTSTVMIVPDAGKKKGKTGTEMKEDYTEELASVSKEIKKLGEKLILG